MESGPAARCAGCSPARPRTAARPNPARIREPGLGKSKGKQTAVPVSASPAAPLLELEGGAVPGSRRAPRLWKPRLYLPFYGMSSRSVERGPGEGARRHPAGRAHRARSPCPCGSPRKRGVPWVLLNPGTPDCKVSPGIPACPLTHLVPVRISLVFTVPVSCEGF